MARANTFLFQLFQTFITLYVYIKKTYTPIYDWGVPKVWNSWNRNLKTYGITGLDLFQTSKKMCKNLVQNMERIIDTRKEE